MTNIDTHTLIYSIFLIFTGAAVLSTVVLFTRQSLLVAYILLGALLGPWGFKLVDDSALIKQVGDIGIIFLLFLLGLHLQPQNLLHMLKKVTWIAIVSSIVFAAIGFTISKAFGFNTQECLIIGAAMMFSSTIIGLKLLPTTILHHQHTGEVMISVLLMQDLIAIIVLFLVKGASQGGLSLTDLGITFSAIPGLILFAFLFERFVLDKLITKFDRIQEYIFLLSIGWCLGMSQLANVFGLSEEMGAFIAGVSIAASPISRFIAESFKPLRDFFLVMFFFAIGASFDRQYLHVVFLPALIMALLLLVVKPYLFKYLLRRSGETERVAGEVGVRLGQASEFSILIAYLAAESVPALIDDTASYLIQATTIITFVVSSYFVVMRYPTPIATSDKMRRD